MGTTERLSLKELKARLDQTAAVTPQMIELAGKASSPTVAYNMAIRRNLSDRQAKATRYLAMAKRDHGLEGFQEIALYGKQTVVACLNFVFQTTTRFLYLSQFLGVEGRDAHFSFGFPDVCYISIVSDVIKELCDPQSEIREAIISRQGLQRFLAYLREADRLVQEADQGYSVDRYAIEKTAWLLAHYSSEIAQRAGISDLVSWSDGVCLAGRQDKYKERIEAFRAREEKRRKRQA